MGKFFLVFHHSISSRGAVQKSGDGCEWVCDRKYVDGYPLSSDGLIWLSINGFRCCEGAELSIQWCFHGFVQCFLVHWLTEKIAAEFSRWRGPWPKGGCQQSGGHKKVEESGHERFTAHAPLIMVRRGWWNRVQVLVFHRRLAEATSRGFHSIRLWLLAAG
jgi:hypothetical protein